jgi:serine protease
VQSRGAVRDVRTLRLPPLLAGAVAMALAVTLALALAAAAPASAARYRGGEVIVRYAPGTSQAKADAALQRTGTAPGQSAGPGAQVVQIQDGGSVPTTVHELDRQPGVTYAVPNYIARAAGFTPNDPGRGRTLGAWQSLQWNFLAATGVDAPDAWASASALGAPGGRGVTVAVLDTGVAYENRGQFRRSPDFSASTFVPGYDFVDLDTHPDDLNGHGTFIAGLVAESTNNRRDLTGLAYNARIMPVRVLDADGLGDAASIGRGIRWAVNHGARIINLSLEFDPSTPPSQIPEVLSAIRYAHGKGVVVVAASGNEAERAIAYPAKAGGVISVGATTEHMCLADYSNTGTGLDLVAPGGGPDADLPEDPAHCHPGSRPGRDIFQLTYSGSSVRRFGFPAGYEGTSMATPHVAAAAALVIATGVIGRRPSPDAVAKRLEFTARDLGPPGYDSLYGYGLLNAAAAVQAPGAAKRRR